VFSTNRSKSWAGRASFTLATALVLLLGSGCDRAKATPGTNTKAPAKGQTVSDEDAPRETDPAKLLFAAMNSQQTDKVAKLVREHPEVLDKPIGGMRPLYLACSRGSLPMARLLVERGADPKAVNGQHQGVLWPAVQSDNVDLVKFLVEKGADPRALQEDDETLLWAAASREMALLLLDAGIDPKHKSRLGDFAIHQACRHSQRDVVEVLLDRGIDVETVGRWNMRPLHSAACTMTGEPKALVRFLLFDKKAKVNSKGMDGHTALHECALFNRYEMADLLLTHGADVNAKDDDGRTPMDLALLAGKSDRVPLINLLIKRGAPGTLIPTRDVPDQ
jgi:ankyrin repeat protein